MSWKWNGRPNHSIVARPVSNLLATLIQDNGVGGATVKEGISRYAFRKAGRYSGSLQSWYQSGSLRSNFTVSLPSPPSLRGSRYGDIILRVTPIDIRWYEWMVFIAAWLYDMETIFHICHIEAHLQVSLASRCLVADARLRWMTLGERAILSRTWAHFRTLVIACFGPVPDEGADESHRDLEIYRAMHLDRYFNFELASSKLRALLVLRNGLRPEIRRFVPEPMIRMTVGNMIDDIMEAEISTHMMQTDAFMDDYQVPVNDAGIGEPLLEAGQVFSEDPIPAVPRQKVPA
ncbi:hypothetical protein TIFTF001_050741 [Ficus carica]|uniref:Uncharacterized protein n=1 Tax=Ficus carica TaxID=3494 RepID=A0AA88CR43_FICCA|nr:hypothetical protein TIFTF001_050741 [Ficus carica]